MDVLACTVGARGAEAAEPTPEGTDRPVPSKPATRFGPRGPGTTQGWAILLLNSCLRLCLCYWCSTKARAQDPPAFESTERLKRASGLNSRRAEGVGGRGKVFRAFELFGAFLAMFQLLKQPATKGFGVVKGRVSDWGSFRLGLRMA